MPLLLIRLIDLYSLIVIVAVIASWIGAPNHHPIVQALRTVTEPALSPIRRVLPATAGLDFSPMVLLIGLQVLKRALLP